MFWDDQVSTLKQFPEIHDVLLNLDDCGKQVLGLDSIMW
jgi:hypothetical protein